jgi:large subunit ribosomal protein L25
MTHSSINVKSRTLYGNQAKKLYREGLTPGIVYGNIKEPISVQFSVKDFSKLFKEAGETHVIDLIIDEGKSIPVIIHALDIHPVSRKLRNVDFKAVDLKKVTTAEVPVILTGVAPAVKEFAGLVSIKLEEIEVEALPEKLPESIIIDISSLKTLEDNIFVKDIIIVGDYKILSDPDQAVVVIETETKEEVEAVAQEVVVDPAAPVTPTATK